MKKMIGMIVLVFVVALAACGPDTNNLAEMAAVYNDALAVENAARLYCADTTCDENQELDWDTLNSYIETIDPVDYDLTSNNGFIAELYHGNWEIYLERSGTGDVEFPAGMTPSLSTKTDCVVDDD